MAEFRDKPESPYLSSPESGFLIQDMQSRTEEPAAALSLRQERPSASDLSPPHVFHSRLIYPFIQLCLICFAHEQAGTSSTLLPEYRSGHGFAIAAHQGFYCAILAY